MPASYAHISTSRASRYLTQLCSHGSLMSRLAHGRPPGQGQGHGGGSARPAATADSSGTEGIIDFGWGRCTLHATADMLTLRAEAGDLRHLQQIQDGITARVERIGRRDQLTVSWIEAPPAQVR
jgi:hypothetical protein